jgi:ATP-dependent helicase/nuclease subunit A
MSQATQCLHEVPYSHIVGGILETGIIDALFLENGSWIVVEFKTDDVRNDEERAQLLRQTDYVAQVQRYRDVVSHMLGHDPKIILCWLNYAGQVSVQADLLDEEVK